MALLLALSQGGMVKISFASKKLNMSGAGPEGCRERNIDHVIGKVIPNIKRNDQGRTGFPVGGMAPGSLTS